MSTSKYQKWLKRYGKINSHNGKIPRDRWLDEWGKQAILDFHDKHPLEGYRRLTFMMLDDEIVAVSPSFTYRVLKAAGRLDRNTFTPSRKGTVSVNA
jgi:putative transposase